MKVLDSKGRLFGVINLIDLFVILFVLALGASIAMNFAAGRSREKDRKANLEIWVKVMYRVPDEVANNEEILKRGDKVLAGNATIEKVLEVRPVAVGSVKDTGFSDIIVMIRANCVSLDNEYYCANMPIKVNSLLTISNPRYIFNNGIILDMEARPSR